MSQPVARDLANDDLQDRLGELFVSRLDRVVPSPDTDLFTTGLLDSLGLVVLITAIEDEFACEIPLDEFEPELCRTISSLTRFLRPVLS